MQPNQNWFFWNCQFWFCLMLAGSSSSFRIPGGGEKPLKPSFNWFPVVYIISTTLYNKVLKVTKYNKANATRNQLMPPMAYRMEILGLAN